MRLQYSSEPDQFIAASLSLSTSTVRAVISAESRAAGEQPGLGRTGSLGRTTCLQGQEAAGSFILLTNLTVQSGAV